MSFLVVTNYVKFKWKKKRKRLAGVWAATYVVI